MMNKIIHLEGGFAIGKASKVLFPENDMNTCPLIDKISDSQPESGLVIKRPVG